MTLFKVQSHAHRWSFAAKEICLQSQNNTERWHAALVVVHWLMALAVIAMLALGFVMTDYKMSPLKIKLFSLHKAIGFTILAFVIVRLLVRWTTPRPPEVSMPRWQQRAASGAHVVLYVLLILMPVSGLVINSAAGFPLSWFGVFSLPSLMEANESLQNAAEIVHGALANALALLVLAHIGAAAYHQFGLRDRLIRRMWF